MSTEVRCGMSSSLPETRKLVDEELAEIINKVLKEGKEEAKFILKLQLSSRYNCGYRYNWNEYIEVIYGDAEIVRLAQYDDECHRDTEVAVIPKTVPAVVMFYHFDDLPQERRIVLYVFNGEGWKSIESRWTG